MKKEEHKKYKCDNPERNPKCKGDAGQVYLHDGFQLCFECWDKMIDAEQDAEE